MTARDPERGRRAVDALLGPGGEALWRLGHYPGRRVFAEWGNSRRVALAQPGQDIGTVRTWVVERLAELDVDLSVDDIAAALQLPAVYRTRALPAVGGRIDW